jgi:hypothetical protein
LGYPGIAGVNKGMIGPILFGVAFLAFIGVALYSVVTAIALWYDYLAFAPSERLGWKRVPRPVIILGIVSITAFVLCVIAGGILAAVTN